MVTWMCRSFPDSHMYAIVRWEIEQWHGNGAVSQSVGQSIRVSLIAAKRALIDV